MWCMAIEGGQVCLLTSHHTCVAVTHLELHALCCCTNTSSCVTTGGKAPAGAARLALSLDGSESEEQLAQINSVDAVVALLDIPVSCCVMLKHNSGCY